MGGSIRHWLTDEVLAAVDRLRPLAEQAGLSMAQLALAWVLREPGISSAIIGASRPEQIADNCAAAGIRLDDDLVERIDEAVAGAVIR
jgi:aryl-alcohol dehydrogenase-like predicted oxidoreductase